MLKATIILTFLLFQESSTSPLDHSNNQLPDTPEIQLKAFDILESKCNVCHIKKKEDEIFTLENMIDYANQINYQVFIKGKMPKGKKNALTEQESIVLKNWLNTTLKK